MKAIIQRVTAAKVTVGDELVSSIGRGLCVLVGISTDDNANDVDWLWRSETVEHSAVRRTVHR
ncbi:D-aminoacyl-tRNA deacylase 1 isoform X2 [Anopheles coustani]|uniref:D-aminoacyl-tRNA deacylase 1 isoform X2 n=1 Tax=Anopheles coustani TaxID=139045 RepID=UPI00265889A6|nr:D-aminoacyl-tRNA deacylase 1 isoform X2 [Anopheles coustani]